MAEERDRAAGWGGMILKLSGISWAGLHRRLTLLNWDGRHGLTLLGLCAAFIGLQLLVGRSALAYARGPLAAGELWRLITAHLIHLDLEHAILNSLGLVLMWALFARDYPGRGWFFIVTGAAAAIDAGLWFRTSTALWYVGSSGVLHGVMAAGTVAHVRRREVDAPLLVAFLVAKLAYEQTRGALPFSGSGEVVVDAHLYGVLGGLLVALFLRPGPGAR